MQAISTKTSTQRDYVREHTALKEKIDKLKNEIKNNEVHLCWLNDELNKAKMKAHELIIAMMDQEKDGGKNMDLIIEIYK